MAIEPGCVCRFARMAERAVNVVGPRMRWPDDWAPVVFLAYRSIGSIHENDDPAGGGHIIEADPPKVCLRFVVPSKETIVVSIAECRGPGWTYVNRERIKGGEEIVCSCAALISHVGGKLPGPVSGGEGVAGVNVISICAKDRNDFTLVIITPEQGGGSDLTEIGLTLRGAGVGADDTDGWNDDGRQDADNGDDGQELNQGECCHIGAG